MIQYTFSIDNPTQQYLKINITFDVDQKETVVHLPSWRPGRYELGNFAKNVKYVKAFDEHNKSLAIHKLNKDTWSIATEGKSKVELEYTYYSVDLNAGSTFLTKDHLYVNPVNCCMFVEGKEDAPTELTLNVPKDWKIACSMTKKSPQVLTAENFDELADSPLIASPNLQYNQYESKGVIFHMWFNGIVKPDWSRLIKDFKAFTDKQIEKFVEFPVPEYHFLFQILPIKAYHGVEHCKSTVIALGPSYEVFKTLYKELLGVSSHELYHTWNVKAIRPIEMMPYDFTKENYSPLGYICEGITTYMGDLFLLKSKVFTLQQYLDELDAQLQKHFDNFGRFNYSVAQSSMDTWLDGYVPGAPNRKVSIYTEGCLLAFVIDTMILQATNNKYTLDEVMKRLYFNYALQGKGVSEQDYKNELEKIIGSSLEEFFKDYINGTRSFEGILSDSLEQLGLELTHKPAPTYSHGRMGFKCLDMGGSTIVKAMYPGGPAELGGVQLEDQILAVNDVKVNSDLDQWLEYFDDEIKTLTIIRAGLVLQITLPEVNRNFYSVYKIVPVKEPNGPQKKALEAWSN